MQNPEGACSCGRDLADAEDLGVTGSFQQEEIPAATAERVQHDLHKAKCACGRVHVAPRPAGVPDSERGVRPLKTQQKISGRLASDDVTQDRLDIRSYIDTARQHGTNAMDVLHNLMLGRPWRPPVQAFSP